MPFIDSKITKKLSNEQKDAIKAELGKAISIMGKSENYLMIGFEDEYDLYMGGNKLDAGAFVSVKALGSINSQASNEMTAEICRIFSDQLGIPGNNVYITYQGFSDWGWNGSNF